MDDLPSEFKVTDAAIEKLHSKLARYQGRSLEDDDDLAEEIEGLLDRTCYEVRRGTVNGKNPNILEIYDAEDGDYGREVYKLTFKDVQQDVTMLGVVTDDHHRRGKPGKVLITVLTYRDAMKSIKDGRWRNRDGTEINLDGMRPPRPAPAPSPHLVSTPPPSLAPVSVSPQLFEGMPSATPGASVTQAVGDSGVTRTVKLGTNGKPLKGYRRGGTGQEREAFALGLLRKNPDMPTMGRDGIHARVKGNFDGIGMRGSVVSRLRAQVQAERRGSALVPLTAGLGELMAGIKALLDAEAGLSAAQVLRSHAISDLRALYTCATTPAPTPEIARTTVDASAA